MSVPSRRKDTVKRLLAQVRSISREPRNVDRTKYWVPVSASARDHWRGTPLARSGLPRAPITVEPEIPFWGGILGFDVRDYYQDPLVYLTSYLRMMVYRFESWDDETAVGLQVPIWLGTTLESSLFGARTILREDASPWLDREPVVKTPADLDGLTMPDFTSSGLMPLAHRYYEVIRELVDEDVTVSFHEWGRSPFGVALHLRGLQNLLEDMMLRPRFAYRLMRLITDARKKWVTDRARFLGEPVGKGNLYNDEVNTPTLSPSLYEEFALPYEQELSAFHGGILYWHSCGDTTALLPLIARIPGLEMFHVGPWTDGEACMRTFAGRVPLEFCLHPVRDVQGADRAGMEARLRGIVRACGGAPYTVRADGLQLFRGLPGDLATIRDWLSVADRVLRES